MGMTLYIIYKNKRNLPAETTCREILFVICCKTVNIDLICRGRKDKLQNPYAQN